MGLASALTTALTGLTAAETTIDVTGNNLANSQTVGFKSSQAVFATQFLQTQSLGSAPAPSTGGTNPRQTGLGTQVAAITPDFTQGTIEISSSDSDLAIQGDGFFIVQGSNGEQLYTRNGVFTTNSQNELVTSSGQRLLGYGSDENYVIQTTSLQPLTIPLGTAAEAQATENVYLEGTLSPSGNVANTAQVIESTVLSDGAIERPNAALVGIATVAPPYMGDSGIAAAADPVGQLAAGTYSYILTYADDAAADGGTQTESSMPLSVNVPSNPDAVTPTINRERVNLTDIPVNQDYNYIRVYRSNDGGTTYELLQEIAMPADPDVETITITDDGSDAPDPLYPLDNGDTISGNYTYRLTYYSTSGDPESRPSIDIGPRNVTDGRIHLTSLPTPLSGAYDKVCIYRNTIEAPETFYLVATVDPGTDYTDTRSDADISDPEETDYHVLDPDGPKIQPQTLLTNVLRRDGTTFENVFDIGTLSFSPKKGGGTLGMKNLEITSTTTVQELLTFMAQASGIQTAADDPRNPVPDSKNVIPGESGTLPPGLTIHSGKIRVVSNNGTANAVSIGLASFSLRTSGNTVESPNLSFGTIQNAVGETAVTDFLAYDSLGIGLNVRVTMSLENLDDTTTTFRWFADSPDNSPLTGSNISVGTGLIKFDGEGNLIDVTNSTVSIQRRNIPSTSPLEFDLNFNNVTGLSTNNTFISASRQDGFSTGKLTSYIIGEDGILRGVFSNGATRDLGQIRLVRFANPAGLEQLGQNLYTAGVNSGLPVEGNPGAEGIGSIRSGALELSNTDIGRNLIDLILAQTQYRGNSRVITTAQELMDELLNLRR